MSKSTEPTHKFKLGDYVILERPSAQRFRHKIGVVIEPTMPNIHNGSDYFCVDHFGEIFYSVRIDGYFYWVKEDLLDLISPTELEKLFV